VAEQAKIRVEVAYARLREQVLLELDVAAGTTAHQAIQQCGILQRFPEIDLAENKIGIFGKVTKLDTPLQAGDRVEIYRPLIADPKEQRKKRAAAGKQMKKGAR
jgi:putative ubiquitin-RnfH superfamily antitoxin RatB of RatAB toxin-antitoxin module